MKDLIEDKNYLKYFICFMMITFQTYAETSQDFTGINQRISSEYPTFRQIGATYSTIFGAMAIWQGSLILDKDKPSNDHFLATATVVVGSMRFVDGSINLFRQTEAEKMANKNEIKDKETLERLARESFYLRMIRSSLIAANSALFLALFAKGDKDYQMLIYPGMIMGAISIVNLFRRTPEEKAMNSLSLVPVKNGGALVYSLQF